MNEWLADWKLIRPIFGPSWKYEIVFPFTSSSRPTPSTSLDPSYFLFLFSFFFFSLFFFSIIFKISAAESTFFVMIVSQKEMFFFFPFILHYNLFLFIFLLTFIYFLPFSFPPFILISYIVLISSLWWVQIKQNSTRKCLA